MVIAYIRTSTDKQETNNQKLEILEYAHRYNIKIDEFVDIVISSRKSESQRRIDYLTETLKEGDTLIVTELSRLGRSTSGIISLINQLLAQQVGIKVLKQNLDLKNKHDMNSKIIVTLFSLFAELERDLMSIRIKEALAAKKRNGVLIGKRKGTIQKSKFDAYQDRILELLKLGLSLRKITKILGFNNPIGLNNYLKKRNLKPTVVPL